MPAVDPQTDQRIVRLCRAGRSEGYRLLLETYQAMVYERSRALLHSREDALDATQEVFLRILPALEGFEEGRPLWPWIRRITSNYCLNLLRDRRPTVPLDAPDPQGTAREPAAPDNVAEAAECDWLQEQLRAALARLSPVERAVVVLRHQEGLSYDEIARHLDLPLGTVKTHLFRARRTLRLNLAAELGG